jgi:hypothetical protein
MEQYCAIDWLHPNARPLLADWYTELKNLDRANYWIEIGASQNDRECQKRLHK